MRFGHIRVGYVAKVFPRRSETFIVNELLAHERAGLLVEVFSLRGSEDQGAHGTLARLQAPITYLDPAEPTVGRLLDALGADGPGDPQLMMHFARQAEVRDVMQAIELAQLVQERGIDHLHAHFANVAAIVARMAATLAGITYSVTAHAKDIFHEDVNPEELAAVLAGASTVITVSDFNVDHLRGLMPGAAHHVHRVYNGIELDEFPFSAPIERPPRILGVGRFVEKKGFDDLIAACALLKAQGREFECRIVGHGILEDDLRAQVTRLGLDDRVTITGPASQELVRAEMATASVLAAPCVVGEDGNRDGLPTVLLEAMALGTPCVATPVTGIPEVLEHERTGLEVPQRTPEALAAALARLIDDADLRVALARRARQLMESRFDVDVNTADWRAVVLEEVSDANRLRVR
jgi:colanic acid/amylovoran biosynthesis glycosyltransferase